MEPNNLGDTALDLVYTPVTPCRIIDTRPGAGGPGPIAAGATKGFHVTGTTGFPAQGGTSGGCGIPLGATSAMINFVAVGATAPGDVRVTPFGTAMPTASILNYAGGVSGLNMANGLAVALCDPATTTCTYDMTLQADGSAINIVADVQGYFRSVTTGGVGTALLADGAVTAPKIASGAVVRSLNGQTDAVTLAGANGLSAIAGSGTVTVTSSATSANTPGTIVARDGSGSFSAETVGLAGTLALPNTSSSSVGTITLGGSPFLHDFGTANTFVGLGAGNFTLTGSQNTAFGFLALASNTTGYWNTAVGRNALMANTAGYDNAAFGGVALQANTTGNYNSAFGQSALQYNTGGTLNTAVGDNALFSNTTASYNSALGSNALYANTTGSYNSAFGSQALNANTTANSNSAFGYQALAANTTGPWNTAVGYQALAANTTGDSNSALGLAALGQNTTGLENSAFGASALFYNTTGTGNSSFGGSALVFNSTGSSNSAFGDSALHDNSTGYDNSAFGVQALYHTTGNGNVAVGVQAGHSQTTGSYNIYLDNAGVAGESNTIHIGTNGRHAATYIAGISGATSASGSAVYVNSSGQLGTATSSRRYKEEIADMAGQSDVLMKLRPVSFYYKPELDASHTRQYGLVAEEVAEVAPELVLNDESGTPQTVRYHFVNALLLNEVQKQRRQLEAQEAEIRELRVQQAQVQELKEQLARLEARLEQ